MPAGRPRKVTIGTLYGLARDFYWELKSVEEGLWQASVHHEKRKRLLTQVEETAELDTEEVIELRQRVAHYTQNAAFPPNENFLRYMQGEIEAHRQLDESNTAIELTQKWKEIPGRPGIIDELLNANTSEQIQKICVGGYKTEEKPDVFGNVIEVLVPVWPISGESILPSKLSQHAPEFIEAKNDPRFPKSGRPTSRLKQLWFLSRALAGAVHGIRTRTAINLIGSVRPDESDKLSKIAQRPRRPMNTGRKQS